MEHLLAGIAIVVSCVALLQSFDILKPIARHDLVAKAGRPVYGPEDWEFHVDLILVNRGNCSEIVRHAVLLFTEDPKDKVGGVFTMPAQPLNKVIQPGEISILRLNGSRETAFSGKTNRVNIAVTTVGVNGLDIKRTWTICQINGSTNGTGGVASFDSEHDAPVRVVANDILPEQHIVQGWH